MRMIERVEAAIRDNIQAALPDGVSVDYRYAAIAAIQAMRDPTQEMIEAEGTHWDHYCHVCGGLKEGWQAMIDAALKESEEP